MDPKKVGRRFFIKGTVLVAGASIAPSILIGAQNKKARKLSHKILTCNIRVALDEDESKGVGWSKRKAVCIEVIKNQKPDIFGLQEVLRNQNEDLKRAFPDYLSFGFEGPEMDKFKGGYHGIAKNPVFFSKKRYELLSAGGYWLSETPLIAGSLSWNSARARNASWVRLYDKFSKKDFRVLNLHLDHKSQEAKEQQIKLALEECGQYQNEFPQILTGDFNASMVNVVCEHIKNSGWKDSYTALHGEAEPGHTVHLFKGDQYEKKDKGRKIDFIWMRGNIKPLSASIIKDNVNGVYPSDHYFVSADLELL